MPIPLNTAVNKQLSSLCVDKQSFTIYTVVDQVRTKLGAAYEVPFSAVERLAIRAMTRGDCGLSGYIATSLKPPEPIASTVAKGRGNSPQNDDGRVLVFFPRRGILGAARKAQIAQELWAGISSSPVLLA